MKKTFKKIAFISMAIATISSMGAMSASASTANGYSTRSTASSWYLQTVAGAPSSVERFVATGTVTGLRNGVDTGVTFRVTNYSDPKGTGAYGKATLTNSSLCLYSGDYVILDSNGDSGTILFQNNWYAVCGGSAGYKVQGYNLVSGGNQRISGNAL